MTASKDSLTREERLAEKLRENLRRRKAQSRAQARTISGREADKEEGALPKSGDRG